VLTNGYAGALAIRTFHQSFLSGALYTGIAPAIVIGELYIYLYTYNHLLLLLFIMKNRT